MKILKIKEIGANDFDDFSPTQQDVSLGDELAAAIGTTWINHQRMSPVQEWTQIAKALRIHGLKIVEAE